MAAKPRTSVVESGSDRQRGRYDSHGDESRAEKRKSGGDSIDGEPMEKKVSMQMKPKIGISSTASKGISIPMGNPGKPPTINHSTPAKTVKLSMGSKPTKDQPTNLKKTSAKVASVFNEDDDSEEEEMPPEAKMRMKNIGRNTPTAAGPNSFGKGRLGFCDRQKVLEREIKQQIDEKADKD